MNLNTTRLKRFITMLGPSLVGSFKAQNISVSFRDLNHQEGLFYVGDQGNLVLPESHRGIRYARNQLGTCTKTNIQR